MTQYQAPLPVYRRTDDDLVEEYHSLYHRFDRLTANQKARFYFVNEEMKARGLGHGVPSTVTHDHNDVWDGEI